MKSDSLLSLFFYPYARHNKTAVASMYPYRTFCDILRHFGAFRKNTQTSTIYICTQITN